MGDWGGWHERREWHIEPGAGCRELQISPDNPKHPRGPLRHPYSSTLVWLAFVLFVVDGVAVARRRRRPCGTGEAEEATAASRMSDSSPTAALDSFMAGRRDVTALRQDVWGPCIGSSMAGRSGRQAGGEYEQLRGPFGLQAGPRNGFISLTEQHGLAWG